MNRSLPFVLVASLGLGACATGPLGPVGAPARTDLPWELSPASTASEAQGEVTIVGIQPELGPIRGTRMALENFHKPMVDFEGRRSRVVEPCRAMAEAQAKPLGAEWVEAGLAGPEVRTRGRIEAPVFVRVLYKKQGGYEVRQAQVSCAIDSRGRLIDLKMGA